MCPIQPLLLKHVIVSLVRDCYSYAVRGVRTFGSADMDDRCKGSQRFSVSFQWLWTYLSAKAGDRLIIEERKS